MTAGRKGVARLGCIFIALALMLNGAAYALLRDAPFDNHLKALAAALVVCPAALYLTSWALRRSAQKELAPKLPVASAIGRTALPAPPPAE